MKYLKEMSFLLTAGIFFISFLAFLLVGFNSLLNAKIDPINKDITKLEMGQKKLETGLKELEAGLKAVEVGQKELKEILLSK